MTRSASLISNGRHFLEVLSQRYFPGDVMMNRLFSSPNNRRRIVLALVLYVLSIGPAIGTLFFLGIYPNQPEHPAVTVMQTVYSPVEFVADTVPPLGIPLRRYQILWLRLLSN